MNCSTRGCTKEARCAIRTTRPTRPNLKTLVFYDDREAPKSASRYCKSCGIDLLTELAATLINED